MVDISSWPTITTPAGWAVQLPLPKEGESGHHVCETASVNECAACKLAREAQDVILRARMMRDRLSAMPNLRGPGSDGFYDGMRGVVLPRREEV